MSSKFDKYLEKGNFTAKEKSAMAELNKTSQSVNETPKASTPVAGAKISNEEGKLDESIADRIKSTQKVNGNNFQNQSGSTRTTSKDSLSKYPEGQKGAGTDKSKTSPNKELDR